MQVYESLRAKRIKKLKQKFRNIRALDRVLKISCTISDHNMQARKAVLFKILDTVTRCPIIFGLTQVRMHPISGPLNIALHNPKSDRFERHNRACKLRINLRTLQSQFLYFSHSLFCSLAY